MELVGRAAMLARLKMVYRILLVVVANTKEDHDETKELVAKTKLRVDGILRRTEQNNGQYTPAGYRSG
jgi:hypothetical protein